MSRVHPSIDTRVGLSFKFMIDIDDEVAGVFTECSGLTATIAVDEWEEGGLNGYKHRLPARTSYENLKLSQAVFASVDLYNWFLSVSRGELVRKAISIVLVDAAGAEVRRWNFDGAFPVKWTGPSLKVDANEVAIEALEIAHNGLIER